MDAIQCVPDRIFGKAVRVGGQRLSQRLRRIYSPKRVSSLSCQSCFNDLQRRSLQTSVTGSCCIVRCQSRWVARHRAKQTGGRKRWRSRETNTKLRRKTHWNMVAGQASREYQNMQAEQTGDSQSDMQINREACRQSDEYSCQTSQTVRNAGGLLGTMCWCASSHGDIEE